MTAKSGNVVDFTGITRLDLDPERVLAKAAGQLASVIVVGFDKDGEEFFASSVSDGGEALWILQRACHKLLSLPDAGE